MPRSGQKFAPGLPYTEALAEFGESRLRAYGRQDNWKRAGVPWHVVAELRKSDRAAEAPAPYHAARRKTKAVTEPEVARIAAKLTQVALDAEAEENPEETRYLVTKITEAVDNLLRRRFPEEELGI